MTPEAILAKLRGVRREGSEWKAFCPAHADKNPSLSIRQADGKVLLHCHAGCSTESVLAALRVEARDLFESGSNGRRVVGEYDYCDEERQLLFQVVRFEPKDFRQRRPYGKGGWHWNLNGIWRVLYRLPEVLANAAGLNGRCNTIQCVESSMFPRTKPSVWPQLDQNPARAAFLLT